MNKQALFTQRSQLFNSIEMRINALRESIERLTQGVSIPISTSLTDNNSMNVVKSPVSKNNETPTQDFKAMAANFDFGSLNLDLSGVSL